MKALELPITVLIQLRIMSVSQIDRHPRAARMTTRTPLPHCCPLAIDYRFDYRADRMLRNALKHSGLETPENNGHHDFKRAN